MAEEFVKSVEEGLKLSKRIYFGKDHSVSAPQQSVMEKNSHLPTSPMVYAVISDPSVVDNPDIPSYQPHVHGRCDPPALIPLHMKEVSMEVACYLDTAFVSVSGLWKVHCVMRSRSCFCRLVVPMGEQGSVLGVEVDVSGRSYSTQLIAMEEKMDMGKAAKTQDGGFLKPQIFTLPIPQVEGGSIVSVKISWSQKLIYNSGQFSLGIPFKFPEFVASPGKGISKREKIMLNVSSGTGTEIQCMKASHPLKLIRKQVGRLACSYEADVFAWSHTDFSFSYAIISKYLQESSSDILGGLLLQSPSMQDFDQREMFCFYLFPGSNQSRKVFRKEVVFLIDISGSMRGRPIESMKNALSAALSKLNLEDSFSIIAFNEETFLFSSSLELATKETIEKATQWMQKFFVAGGGTNILLPLNQALGMLSNTFDSVPLIILITDGAVEDERHICDLVRSQVSNRGSRFPRISTFGIGTYCNHYFLQVLALIGRGYYDAAYCPDSIDIRFQRLYTTASSTILANITIDKLDHLETNEVYPRHIPDLSAGSPLIVSGRYQGEFPDSLKVSGLLADMSNFTINLKVQRAKEIPLDKVVAKKQIDMLTAQAWLSQSKELEEKVVKISIQSSLPSEYTRMVLLQTERGKQAFESVGIQEVLHNLDLQKLVDSKGRKIILLRSLGYGFGNSTATAENKPPRFGEPLLSDSVADPIVKAASNCCTKLCDCWCGMCCIRTCSQINEQCAIVLTQLCAALSCFGCLSWCAEVCCDF
ncbi:von Willebrand factor [Macleaya cordata]|uniref:von Willebrand factor n=1 Tax=Macleaya cordata TaxID=56857 RepID=A0A200Q196_MACCD|nr:von Willebrand factor [Macleaya cordata]